MSNKGNSRHLKRLAASAYAGTHRKEAKYLLKPRPGRHSVEQSITLASLIRDKIAYAKTLKEAESVIKKGNIELNGKIVKDEKQAVGFGDLVHIVPTNEYFAIGVNRQGAISVSKASSDAKRIAKIVGKYVTKHKKIMLRLHDGTVVAAPDGAKVNDSVVLAEGKVERLVKFEPGVQCVVYKGRHTGEIGKLKSIKPGTAQSKATVELEAKSGIIQTLAENIIAVGA
ncbi:MAG: S4 domain-containing protein [Candidatus Micrarchaeia archaeon]